MKKEAQYFIWVLVIPVLVWALIAISIVGLLYAALFAFIFWIANGLLVAQLRSEAVRVIERQMPALHELTSTYPTLSRRTADLDAVASGAVARSPARHPLAYLLAFFMPGGGAGAAQSMLIMVVLIGFLAALAIPAFGKVRETSQVVVCKNNHRQITLAFDSFTIENEELPGNVEDFIGPGKVLQSVPICLAGGTYDYSVDDDKQPVITCSVHGTIADMETRMPGRR